MAKMTKAQARKRLSEASTKIALVNIATVRGEISGLTPNDTSKLFSMVAELSKLINKMK